MHSAPKKVLSHAIDGLAASTLETLTLVLQRRGQQLELVQGTVKGERSSPF